VSNIAKRLGYAVVPDYIRGVIINKMISDVKCSNGEYALSKYRVEKSHVLTTFAFAPTVKTYLSSYQIIDPYAVWNVTASYHSSGIWNNFIQAPDSALAAFTLFSGRKQKTAHFSKLENVITAAFAHVSVSIIYRIDGITNNEGFVPMRFTGEVLAGIFGGTILYWNDTAIQNLNLENAKNLPHKRITVVVRSVPSDTNSIFLRYLSLKSSIFRGKFSFDDYSDFQTADFTSAIESGYLIDADTSSEIDEAVTYYDGSIGYFLHVTLPTSAVAGVCRSASDCDKPSSAKPVFPNDGGSSLAACANDKSTVISLPYSLTSFDLMTSTDSGCYPLVGTVDISIYSGVAKSCPAVWSKSSTTSITSATSNQDLLINTRIKFTHMLYDGQDVIRPLAAISLSATSNADRADMRSITCNIKCDGVEMGYSICGYRDCTWDSHDFLQRVTSCNDAAFNRLVYYEVKNSSTCLKSNLDSYTSSTYILCEYLPSTSIMGSLCYSFASIGALICTVVFILSVTYRNDKIFRKSQPMFVFIFLLGAIGLNFTILALMGPNTSTSCLLRPWLFNLFATLMFSPLIMKLRRVHTIFNNPTLRKIKVTNLQVGCQVIATLAIDVIILTAWTIADRPNAISVSDVYASALESVTDMKCNTGLDNKFEVIMLTYKCALIAYAIRLVSN